MGTGCGFPKQDPPPPRLSRDATQLHNTPYNDSCKKLLRFGLVPGTHHIRGTRYTTAYTTAPTPAVQYQYPAAPRPAGGPRGPGRPGLGISGATGGHGGRVSNRRSTAYLPGGGPPSQTPAATGRASGGRR